MRCYHNGCKPNENRDIFLTPLLWDKETWPFSASCNSNTSIEKKDGMLRFDLPEENLSLFTSTYWKANVRMFQYQKNTLLVKVQSCITVSFFPKMPHSTKKTCCFLVLTHLLHIFATWPRGPHVSEFPHGRRGKAGQQQPHQKAAARLELIGETSSKWWIYAIMIW
jgi:hypothetical protein